METFDEPSRVVDGREVVVGIDIGGSNVALMATDATNGEELARDRFPTPHDGGSDAMIAQLCEAVRRLMERTERPREALCAVGVAVSGLVDPRDGRVIVAGNLRGWLDIPLRAILRHELGIPAWLDQDANGALYGAYLTLDAEKIPE